MFLLIGICVDALKMIYCEDALITERLDSNVSFSVLFVLLHYV